MPNPTDREELAKATWHLLASQMTHAINCKDIDHIKQNSCEDFTKANHDELMQLFDTYADQRVQEAEKRGYETGLKQLASNMRGKFHEFQISVNDMRNVVNKEVDRLLKRADIPTKAALNNREEPKQ